MTITPANITHLSEQRFNIELSGLELAVLGSIMGKFKGGTENSYRRITDDFF